MSRPTSKIPARECVAYGLGDAATNFVWGTLMVFLNYFYTDVFGLDPAVVGTLMLVCRFGDGIISGGANFGLGCSARQFPSVYWPC